MYKLLVLTLGLVVLANAHHHPDHSGTSSDSEFHDDPEFDDDFETYNHPSVDGHKHVDNLPKECVTQQECLDDIDNIGETYFKRLQERKDLALALEATIQSKFDDGVLEFNALVGSTTPECHAFKILTKEEESAVLTNLFANCRALINTYPPKNDTIEQKFVQLGEAPKDPAEKEAWKVQYCEIGPIVGNHYCGFYHHQYEIVSNQCKLGTEFVNKYLQPWKNCYKSTGKSDADLEKVVAEHEKNYEGNHVHP